MISYYELLGLIKKDKQPDKVRYGGYIYKWNENSYYCEYDNELLISRFYDKDLVNAYCIEIIEDKPNKIEEIKLNFENDIIDFDKDKVHYIGTNRKDRNVYIQKINELIKAVNYLLEVDKHE